jgi:type IV secretion system protein TrbG
VLKEVTGTAVAAALGAGSWGIAVAQTSFLAGAPTRIPAVTQAADGSTRYVFGTNIEPLLTCRPLFVCDVTLQAGERILNIAIGDSVRWVVATAQSGPGGETPHLFLKPTERDLATNLVVTTTKRTYYLRLNSADFLSSPRISFSYPDDDAAAALARAAAQRAQAAEDAAVRPVLPPSQLDYNYRIQGAHEILPDRVYNDGVHSFIEYARLPADLPVVYAVAPDGSDQIVNYRLRETTFVVDGIASGFDLVLNGGTGKHGRGEQRAYVRHK